jgi:hypothetical protein
MKHCHISLCCNELPFLKQKLNFLYENFDQLIFVDFDLKDKCNSKDGSIEYIESFDDKENKIKLIKNYNEHKIDSFNGYGFVEKKKMFAVASKFIKDDIDIIWATDLDEFFDKNLILEVEDIYKNQKDIVSIEIPFVTFVYNQYCSAHNKDIYHGIARITKHIKGKIYGHCNFKGYGKTLILKNYKLFHFSFVGYKRAKHKLEMCVFNPDYKIFLDTYLYHLKNGDKNVILGHPNKNLGLKPIKYNGRYPKFLLG